MASSDSGGDNDFFEENNFVPVVVGSTMPQPKPILEDHNVPPPRTNPLVLPIVVNSLSYEQLNGLNLEAVSSVLCGPPTHATDRGA
ncbi:UNVERIFIED_CONTAM: hypothetical protein Sindi_0374000, partial [Sesamum indicum]